MVKRLILILHLLTLSVLWAQSPKAKVITLDLNSTQYQSIVSGQPESVTMESGFVSIEPGKTVGDHDSKTYEEVLIVLDGQGQLRTKDGVVIELRYGSAAYCPPHTQHDVINTGTQILKYIYVAANTKP